MAIPMEGFQRIQELSIKRISLKILMDDLKSTLNFIDNIVV
jgi:hypothetical protein